MSRIFTAFIVAVIATAPSYAFDLGGLVEEVTKTKKTEPSQAIQESKETKPSGLSGLLGLAGETPVKEEVAIGREIAGRLLGASPLVNDKQLQKYINEVGKWVSMQSSRSELTWRFGVIDSDDINAFAAPGGYILVTKGLYKRLYSEAELAGVLAHEIGHVIKKHHLKILKKSKLIDMGGGLLKSQVGSGDPKGQAINKVIGSGAEIMARGLDKEAEYEADRIGVVLATRAGYDSYGLPVVLQEIGHVSADDSSVGLLFKTHPHPDVRLAELGDAMGDQFDQYEDGRSLAGRFYKLK